MFSAKCGLTTMHSPPATPAQIRNHSGGVERSHLRSDDRNPRQQEHRADTLLLAEGIGRYHEKNHHGHRGEQRRVVPCGEAGAQRNANERERSRRDGDDDGDAGRLGRQARQPGEPDRREVGEDRTWRIEFDEIAPAVGEVVGHHQKPRDVGVRAEAQLPGHGGGRDGERQQPGQHCPGGDAVRVWMRELDGAHERAACGRNGRAASRYGGAVKEW